VAAVFAASLCESAESRVAAGLTLRSFAMHITRIDSAASAPAAPTVSKGHRVCGGLLLWPHHPCGVRRRGTRMVSFSPGQESARLLLEGPQRYTCLAGGTRSGKTFLIIRAIVARGLAASESRHAILRFHANAARASISLDTLPHVMRLCFPRVALKEHRQDGFFELPNGARIWVGALDDKERVEKILGLEYDELPRRAQRLHARGIRGFRREPRMERLAAQVRYASQYRGSNPCGVARFGPCG